MRRYGQDYAENKRRWDKQFGITKSNQMSTDAGTMSKESWLAKYPDMTEADYTMASRMSDLAYQTSAHTLVEMRDSYAGNQVYDYYMSHPDASYATDQGARQALQTLYDTKGGQAALGDFETWAANQESALRDPRMTTTLGALEHEMTTYLDRDGDGVLNDDEKTQLDDFMTFMLDSMSGKLTMERVTVWRVGGKTFDSEQGAIDYANENDISTDEVRSASVYRAIDANTGEVYGGDGKFNVDSVDSTKISATSYGSINGLSYGSGDMTGNLSNGETFTIDGSMKVETLSYNLPKGDYTVKEDADGNVWYEKDGKYYLGAVSDVGALSEIRNDSELISKISNGLDEMKLPEAIEKKEVNYLAGGDPSVLSNNEVFFLPEDMKFDEHGVATGPDGTVYTVLSDSGLKPSGALTAISLGSGLWALRDDSGHYWYPKMYESTRHENGVLVATTSHIGLSDADQTADVYKTLINKIDPTAYSS